MPRDPAHAARKSPAEREGRLPQSESPSASRADRFAQQLLGQALLEGGAQTHGRGAPPERGAGPAIPLNAAARRKAPSAAPASKGRSPLPELGGSRACESHRAP